MFDSGFHFLDATADGFTHGHGSEVAAEPFHNFALLGVAVSALGAVESACVSVEVSFVVALVASADGCVDAGERNPVVHVVPDGF